jgi:hypothetical protein
MEVPWSREETLQRIRNALDKEILSIKGLIVDHHVTLKIPAEDQHFWSPQLDLEVEEQEEGSLIRELFGPKPSVWLMFVFFYSLLGFIAVIVMVMGFSQWNLGMSAGILWLLPVMAFLVIMVYLSARAGQKLGEEEMLRLNQFLHQALERNATLESTQSREG